MNFIKRAWIYCLRNRIRTGILFLVMTVISTFILVSVAIQSASDGATVSVQTAIGGKITLELDADAGMGAGQQNQWGTVYSYNGDLITQDIVNAIAKVEGVVDYNAEDTAAYYGAGVDFQYLPASYGFSYTPYGEASSYTATISSGKCTKFQNGKYKLVAGRHITPEDAHVCLISKELADYNTLSVGDEIQMYSLDTDAVSKFEIVGIFDGTEGTSGNALTVDEIPANCGYIDYATMFELFGESLNGYQQLTIYVDDPVGIQSAYNRILDLPELKGKSLKLTMDTDEYKEVETPLKALKKVVTIILILISVVSVGILTLLLTIWIRARKKEIGILLSIGRGKHDIMLQIFSEVFMVAIIAFAASMPLGVLLAQNAGTYLVSKIAAGMAQIHVRIEAKNLFLLCVIGICVIIVSVFASLWTIVHQKPRDILTKMS